MAHHAYVYTGGRLEGIEAAYRFCEERLNLSRQGNPDVTLFEFDHLSVDDARRIGTFAAQAPTQGEQKAIIIVTGRFFEQAQNAFLKIFEEPPEGTTLFLILPAEGVLLPTLRSRLITLPRDTTEIADVAQKFLDADPAEREKIVTKLIARSKADKDKEDERQAARLEAVRIVEGIMRAAYAKRSNAKGNTGELDLLLKELDRFMPIMHERSAPLKLIFEHLRIVLPAGL